MTDYEMIFLCKLGAALIAYFISLGLAYHLGKLRVLYIWQKAEEAEEAIKDAQLGDKLIEMARESGRIPIDEEFNNRMSEWWSQFNEEDFEDGNEE